MLDTQISEDRSEKAVLEQAQAELVAVFEKMPYEIPLILFSSAASPLLTASSAANCR